MSLWLVVPVKSLSDGKSRLAPALEAAQRAAFIERLLGRTLEQAAQYPGLERTLVVSADEQAHARASAWGVRVLEERAPGGLNNALRQAQLALSGLGATQMLVVSCDLPLLQAEDLRRLAGASVVGTIGLAPDRARQGTNGICLQTPYAFDFSFGPDSFERHLNRVRQLDLHCAIVDRAGLAFDVDTPEDLAEFRLLEQGGSHLLAAIETQ